jgi:ATP synthase F1 complex assembly factor 2
LSFKGNPEWVSLQKKEWDPLVQWFKERYGVDIEPSTSITGPTLSSETRNVIQKHLHSFDFWALNGLLFAVEAAKSLILALACVDMRLTVEESVCLATLETEFQVKSICLQP